MSPTGQPAIFLDRDGTLIEDRGHLHQPSQVVFYPFTFQALRGLQTHFRLFIVTHQGGIAQGLITAAQAAAVNDHVVRELAARDIEITRVYTCPHDRREQCHCLKPQPHFLQEAAREYGIDLSRSFTVGDHPHDVDLAAAAGAKAGILVLTGHGCKHLHEMAPDTPTAASLAEAAVMIAQQIAGENG